MALQADVAVWFGPMTGRVLIFLTLDFLSAALATEGYVMGAVLAVVGSTACEATEARAGRLPCACSCA